MQWRQTQLMPQNFFSAPSSRPTIKVSALFRETGVRKVANTQHTKSRKTYFALHNWPLKSEAWKTSVNPPNTNPWKDFDQRPS